MRQWRRCAAGLRSAEAGHGPHGRGVDGIEATRRIRKAHPNAKVIIVTDVDDDAVRQAARSAGACGYALKDNLLDLPGLVESLV